MITIRHLLLGATAALSLAACAPAAPPAAAEAPKPNAAADEAAVRAVNPAWFKALSAGDAAGVASLYAADAVLSPPGAPAARGQAAILEYFTREIAAMSSAGLTNNMGTDPTEVGVSGDLAWEWGTYNVTDKAGKIVEIGKFTSVLARRDGAWKLIRDTWNSDVAASPAPAADAPKK
jgi:uncharacterized protein (TIGR02246 family)